MMSKAFSFPPAANGLDYLQSVVDHLSGEPDNRDLKYAVLHLQAATEVLLKVRLVQEDWVLVFKDVNTASQAAYVSGDFISIGMVETLARLKSKAGVELPESAVKSFKRLAKERNKLQHFGLEAQAAVSIESLAGEVFDALLVFLTRHLQPQATGSDKEMFDEALDLIKEEMTRIKALTDARLKRITPELDANADLIVDCPGCLQLALFLDDPRECLFCERQWEDAEQAASEYGSEVLGITWHDIADGAEEAVKTCPSCDRETLVWGVRTHAESQHDLWACFSCCETYERKGFDRCVKCERPIMVKDGEEDLTVCVPCWDEAVYRE